MIIGSLLLVIGAIVLLAVGLVDGSDPLLVGSIAASLLAAIALVVGGRRSGAERAPAGEESAPVEEELDLAAATDAEDVATGYRAEDGTAADRDGPDRVRCEPATAVIPAARVGTDDPGVLDEVRERGPVVVVPEPMIPAQGGASGRGREQLLDGGPDDVDASGVEEPPDEPIAQRVPAGDAARVARMSDEVLVIDGRPRYHLAGCTHLLGRTSERLPVHEAVELGFTPCGLCEPDSALLAKARRA